MNHGAIKMSMELFQNGYLISAFPLGSVADEPDYVGFYGAYLFQFITMLDNSIYVCASASIYVGMFYYINGMTEHIKLSLKSVNGIQPEEVRTHTYTLWQACVHEMKFHTKIIW